MLCQKCGSQLDLDAKFCSQCGAYITQGHYKKDTVFHRIKEKVLRFLQNVTINRQKVSRKQIVQILAGLAAVLILVILIAGGGKQGRTYRMAMDYMDSGDYAQAAELFKELGDYKDADLQYKKANYDLAEELLSLGDYEKSADLFFTLKLTDYEDSAQQYKRTRYFLAEELAEQGNNAEALLICDELLILNYQTSAVQFLKGQLLLDQGENYQAALELFEALADENYTGAKDMVTKTRYEWAKDLIRQDQKLDALEMLGSISANNYEDTAELTNELAEDLYEEAKGYYRSGRYEKAQDYFSKLYPFIDTTYFSRLTSIYLDIEKNGYYNANEMFADPQWAFYLDDFRDHFYVENTAEAMLSCTNLACAYLEGTWRTSNNSHYFTMERNKNGYSFYNSYNLPWYGGDFVIKNGVYYVEYNGKDTVQFRMKLTGPDTLEIYAAKDGRTYVLTRR